MQFSWPYIFVLAITLANFSKETLKNLKQSRFFFPKYIESLVINFVIKISINWNISLHTLFIYWRDLFLFGCVSCCRFRGNIASSFFFVSSSHPFLECCVRDIPMLSAKLLRSFVCEKSFFFIFFPVFSNK